MKTRKGFTLIELLVVISIIALLMSMMMPALSKVKAIARDMLCMSNVKNWGLAFALYTGDHDDYFYDGLKQGMPINGLWYHALRRYYAPDDPAFSGPKNPETINGSGYYWGGKHDDIMRCPMAIPTRWWRGVCWRCRRRRG
jgi:prepilin-type N-terminal cleavage/methylation domain-containing protein